MRKILVTLILPALLTVIFYRGFSQQLSFSYPQNYLKGVTTDKAIDITNFKSAFFVTWKDEGSTGNINVCYLGKQYGPGFTEKKQKIASQSAFAPVLRITENRMYLFWIAADGSLKYVLNNSETGFDVADIHTCQLNTDKKLSGGITAAAVGDKVMITSHQDDKNHLVYAILEPGADGIFKPAALTAVPVCLSDSYPFVVSLSPVTARATFKGYKDLDIYYSDYNLQTNTWTKPAHVPVLQSRSDISPAVYRVFNSDRLFYMWKGSKKDNRIYYSSRQLGSAATQETELPGYFTTNLPLSICDVDERKFIMSFVGEDKKLYLSYFTNYNPASWMAAEFFPAKGNLTLKDVVIPGSHDAGLSVLNGVGGQQSGTINECNTLTQVQNIGKQLNAGMRMFDLRIGTYKKQLYTKHCAADCMQDAIGGAYGEKLSNILTSVKEFLKKNNKEFVIITFSHFCERETPMNSLSDSIVNVLGGGLMYDNQGKDISKIKLNDLSGKVIITFERYAIASKNIDSSSMAERSGTFMNIRREYAASNKINYLLAREKVFFNKLSTDTHPNDIIRLDWQLTQSSDEAAMVCNDFQDEKTNPIINGAMLLTNIIREHRSIIDQALNGNKLIASAVNNWITDGVINNKNKPNIIYVDAAGAWVTDYCIALNRSKLYNNHP